MYKMYQVLDKQARENLVDNLAGHMVGAQEFIWKRAVHNFGLCHPEYGRQLQERINYYLKKQQKV